MSFSRRQKALGFAAGATALALLVAGCSSSDDDDATTGAAPTTDNAEPITLTVATFNNFGYTDELLASYTETHPNVTVVQTVAATSNDARTNYFAKLGTGGLADVEAIEVDWLPEVMQYADMLEDLSDASAEGRWLDWKTAAATDAEGRLIGAGTDIGPQAICYNADLFAQAGLPTDPAGVAALLEGDWDNYFAVGEEFTAATGKPWFDSAGGIWQGMINQVEAAYEDPSTGEIIAADNPEVEAIFTDVAGATTKMGSGLSQWSDDWFAALASGGFGTMLCPGWMLGVIQGTAPDATAWNVADVFPNGGGNWGGSYLTVPANGANVDAAKELALWLTAPEQQLSALAAAGTFPSQVAALEDPAALNAAFTAPGADGAPSKAEYFNSDNLGEIFANRSTAIAVSPFKGENYFKVNDVFNNALTRVADGSQDAATSWAQALQEIAALG